MLAVLAPVIAFGLASVAALPLSANHTLHARAANKLFPVSDTTSWSVSSAVTDAFAFNDDTFRPEHEIKDLTHPYVAAPDGVQSMQVHYPKGSFKLSAAPPTPRGGLSFYAPGPASVDLTTAQEATLSYSVFFPDGFDFVKGGKLPGLCTYRRPSLCFRGTVLIRNYRRRKQRRRRDLLFGGPARRRLLLCALHVAHGRQGRAVHVSPAVLRGEQGSVQRRTILDVQRRLRRVGRPGLVQLRAGYTHDDRAAREAQRRRHRERRDRAVCRGQKHLHRHRPGAGERGGGAHPGYADAVVLRR